MRLLILKPAALARGFRKEGPSMSAKIHKMQSAPTDRTWLKWSAYWSPFGDRAAAQVDVARLAIGAIKKIREEPESADDQHVSDQCQRMMDAMFLACWHWPMHSASLES
jgi:hypothetical protein